MLHSPLLAPELIGRETELRALEALLDGARQGRGAVALLGGDAGIGKTRLSRELKASAAQRQMRVIEGRSSQGEVSLPYGPFMDALRFRLARGEGEAASQVLAPVLAHVVPLFAALGEGGAASQADATGAPFEAIWRVLERLAGLGPLLFIIEDVHWADPTSHDLLLYLARRVPSLAMVMLVTYRTDEVHPGHPVHRLAAALVRERALRIQLEPLVEAEVGGMLESMLGARCDQGFVEAVHRRTEGNPLFIEELVGALAASLPDASHTFAASDLARVTAPATLHEMVWERLSPLGGDAREVLTVASVIGRRFRFDVLARALGGSEDRLGAELESLIEQRLLVEASDAPDEAYAFRHSLVQEVLYSTTIGRRRRVWHRKVAEALEAIAPADALPHTTLAHHYRLAGDPERAREHSVLAGDEAARLCAWKDAEAMYEAALASVERAGGDPALEADILERMANVAWWQNRIEALEQYSADALAIRRTLGDRHGAARLLRRIAILDADQRGAIDRAIGGLEEALVLVDADSVEHACLANDLGRLRLRQGELERAAELFEVALAVSGCLPDCNEEAFSLAMLGWLAIQAGDIPAGTQRLEVTRSLITEAMPPLDRVAEIFHAGIRAFDASRQHRRAREWVDAALTHARHHHAAADIAVYSAYAAAVQRRAGEWDAAASAARAAVEELRASGRAELREALRILGDMERGRGDLDAARAAYEEALARGETTAAIGQALLLLAECRWDAAASILEVQLERRPDAERLFTLRVLPILVEAYAEAGRRQETEAAVDRLRRELAVCDYPAGEAALAQSEAWLNAVRGDEIAAAIALRRAAILWRQMELPFEAARASLLLAERLIAASETPPGEAVAAATEAAAAFQALGAPLDLARADRALRSAGVRVARRRRPADRLPEPLDRLTRRELEVLMEIAKGHTNKQIARTLSMATRTVGNHVSAILGKLGCGTRTEASRLAMELRAGGVEDT